jgi:mono/diheme cytochrome c family protein
MIATLAVVFACGKPPNQNQEQVPPMQSKAEIIKRGELLVTTSACHDCHSPKIMTDAGMIPDTTRLLSGHPQDEAIPKIPDDRDGWVLFSMGLTASLGPWGISYAANLTPDDTGIGNWTLEQFKTAISKGKYKGLEDSRPLLPPMPWQQIKNLSDQDLEAIFTYLQSIKPVKNLVPFPVSPDQVKELR